MPETNPALAALKKQRNTNKGKLTNLVKYAREDHSDTSLSDLMTRLRRVEQLMSEFTDLEFRIFTENPEEESDLAYEENYYNAMSTLNKWIRAKNLNSGVVDLDVSHNATQNGEHSSQVKLPKIHIPSFAGDYSEWQSFYDMYTTTIHESPNLSPVQKFQYLKGLLRGEAAVLLRHINVTESNYIGALNKLKERYDRKKHIVNTFIRTFIEQPAIQQSTASNIKRIMDTSDEVIRGLKALGEIGEKRDPWLIYIILQKLDNKTKALWAEQSADIINPEFAEFLKFLGRRTDTLESLATTTKRTTPRSLNVRSHVVSEEPEEAVESLAALKPLNNYPCAMCQKEGHTIFYCDEFHSLDLNGRNEFIKGTNRCFNCFGTHSIIRCPSRRRCQKCRKKHNTLLHHEETKDDSQSVQPTSSKDKQVFHSQVTNTSVIVPTAIVKVLDDYSPSFSTEDYAQRRLQVNLKTSPTLKFVNPHFNENTSERLFLSEEMSCENHLIEKLKWDPHSRFIGKLPAEESLNSLGESLLSKIERLRGIERIFIRAPTFTMLYRPMMETPSAEVSQKRIHLPPHGVLKTTNSTADNPLPQKKYDPWSKLIVNLKIINEISIPRFTQIFKYSKFDLFGTYHASQHDYAAVFFRKEEAIGNVSVQLISSKTRIASITIKQQTTACLEPCAAIFLDYRIKNVRSELNSHIRKISTWTDSQIVSDWLRSHPKLWIIFISNRTDSNLSNLNPKNWRHVHSADNPANGISRCMSPSEFRANKHWWNETDGLKYTANCWPPQPKECSHLEKEFENHQLYKDDASILQSYGEFRESRSIKSVGPFVAEQGFIRVKRRLQSSLACYSSKPFININPAKLQKHFDKVIKFPNNISDYLSRNSITWKFILSTTTSFRSFCEAAIKSSKFQKTRIIEMQILILEKTLQTAVDEILNSQLFCVNYDTKFKRQTPSHCLIGRSSSKIPEANIVKNLKISKLARWQMRQQTKWKSRETSLQSNAATSCIIRFSQGRHTKNPERLDGVSNTEVMPVTNIHNKFE